MTTIPNNLYQLTAYLRNNDASTAEGVLIYPTVQQELNATYSIEGHKVTFATINLNQNWQQIHQDLFSIIQ